MEALIGITIGAVITWVVTWLYYRKAAKELTEETAELRRLADLILRGLEHAGMVELSRDTSDEILGFVITAKVGTASIGVRTDPPTVKIEPAERTD